VRGLCAVFVMRALSLGLVGFCIYRDYILHFNKDVVISFIQPNIDGFQVQLAKSTFLLGFKTRSLFTDLASFDT
jgi:hypothetical protein